MRIVVSNNPKKSSVVERVKSQYSLVNQLYKTVF